MIPVDDRDGSFSGASRCHDDIRAGFLEGMGGPLQIAGREHCLPVTSGDAARLPLQARKAIAVPWKALGQSR